jgi:multisubunit Na+/H+ antiporter MnhB subunit
MRHPNVPLQPGLKRGRLILGVIGIVLFLLTFTATPFYDSSLMHFFHIDPFETVGR